MKLPTAGILLALVAMLGSSTPPPRDLIGAKVRNSVKRGLHYLMVAQNRDGSWGDDIGYRGDISETTIAIIALLNTGSTLRCGKYHRQIRRGVDWAMRDIKRGVDFGKTAYHPTHSLIQRKLGPNIDLYYAALLLSQIIPLELEPWEEKYARKKLKEFCDAIAGYQQSNGAFETSYEPMLTTVTAWLTLRQAHAIGIAVEGASVDKVMKYLKNDCFEASTGIFRERKWNNRERFVTQAGGLRVFYAMGSEKLANIKKATGRVARMKFDQDVGGRAGGEEFLAALFAVQALQMGDPKVFHKFYKSITKSLMKVQNRDGSWTGHHCITAKVYCTACTVIAMLAPDKLLPMVER